MCDRGLRADRPKPRLPRGAPADTQRLYHARHSDSGQSLTTAGRPAVGRSGRQRTGGSAVGETAVAPSMERPPRLPGAGPGLSKPRPSCAGARLSLDRSSRREKRPEQVLAALRVHALPLMVTFAGTRQDEGMLEGPDRWLRCDLRPTHVLLSRREEARSRSRRRRCPRRPGCRTRWRWCR